MDNVKHLLWYDHYKGPVYPLDLSVDPDSVRMQKLGELFIETCEIAGV